jgi:nucleoside-diphosphate-sugar epimerase
MRILVTGATGFIGSHLVDQLLEEGNEVIASIRKSSNLRWLKDKPVKLIEANFDNSTDLEKLVADVDYVYHIAGLVAAKNYTEFLKANKNATENLIQACIKVNPNLDRFVLVSSQTVAGPSSSLENPQTEDDIPKPITSYGKSKLEGEKVAVSYMDKLPITIVRPPAVFGPRDTAIKDIFAIVNKGIAPLIGWQDKYVSLIYVKDLVSGIILAGESKIAEGQIYFISSNRFYTWQEIMSAMKIAFNKKHLIKIKIPHTAVLTLATISEFFGRFSNKPPVFNYEKGIDFIQKYWICSPNKAENDLDFTSETPLDDGISETADWYLKNKWI